MDTTADGDLDTFIRTRHSMQTVAEHVLSAALHAATGRIGLRRTPGGFGTPPFPSPDGERHVRVSGSDLVVTDDRGERAMPISTVRELAAFAGTEPGAPTDVYTPTTPLELDAALEVDEAAARRLADWYELVEVALARFRDELADRDPSIAQLWPEHFDLALTVDGVNYGGSPGDGGIAGPYLYVGPHELPPPAGDYWNESFGASLTADDSTTVDAALAFFRRGRMLLGS